MMNDSYTQTIRRLRSVGISTFIKYYFVFKFYPQEKCIQAFDEADSQISESSKVTKTNAAKSLFRDGLHLDALRYIRDSAAKIPHQRKQEAAWYLQLEE